MQSKTRELAPQTRYFKAYTLIETLIVVLLLSTLIVSGAPSLGQWLDKRRNQAQAVQLRLSLSLARNYALANSVDVVLCPAETEQRQQCRERTISNLNWNFGWLVFADQDRDGKLGNNEPLLQSLALLKDQAVVFNQNGRLRFFPTGGARSAGFYVCNASQSAAHHIRLLHTGRSRTKNELSETQASHCRAGIES